MSKLALWKICNDMKKNTKAQQDELTEKMHSEFNISKEQEVKLKVMLAKQDMKKLKYSAAQVCELYGLSEEDIGIVENI